MKSSVFGLCLLALTLTACSTQRTPPGADSIFASVDSSKTNVALLQWKDGLQIVLADRFTSHNTHGHGSTSEPFFLQTGSASSKDSKGYEWEIKTQDGKQADLTIAGKSFDVTKGNLFVVYQLDDKIEVKQHQIELPKHIESSQELTQAVKKNAKFAEWTKVLN